MPQDTTAKIFDNDVDLQLYQQANSDVKIKESKATNNAFLVIFEYSYEYESSESARRIHELRFQKAKKEYYQGLKNRKTMARFELVSKYQNKGLEDLIPKRQTQYSAGYDFKAVKDTLIPANIFTPTLVSTGVKAKLDYDQVLILANRSSNALKRKLIVPNGVGIIDADYYNNPDNEGEIMGMFINLGEHDYLIRKGDRIMQGIITDYGVTEDDNANGFRQGGFGSTKK